MITKDSYCLALSFAIDCIQNLKENVLGDKFVFNLQFRKCLGEEEHAAVLNCVIQLIKIHAFSI